MVGPDAHMGDLRRGRFRQGQLPAPLDRPQPSLAEPPHPGEVLAAAQARHRQLPGLVEHLPLRAPHQDPAPFDHQQLLAEAVGLLQVVGHQQGRHPAALQQLAQLLLQLAAQVGVLGGEGLIQQQQLRLDRQGPHQGDALLLPARELPRISVRFLQQAHPLQQPGHPPAPLRRRQLGQAEAHVLGHRAMGEQGVVLQHQGDAPLPQGHIDAPSAIEQHPPVQLDAAAIGPLQPRQAAQQLALARPRGAQQPQPAAVAAEGHLQAEARQLPPDRHLQLEGAGRPPRNRHPGGRHQRGRCLGRALAAPPAPPAGPGLQGLQQPQGQAVEQQHQRREPPGPAALAPIHRRVDRQRQGLGAARDVARQQQGGAEFPQGPREAQAQPRHQARQGQGQRDPAPHPPLARPQAAGHIGQGAIDRLQRPQAGPVHQRKGHHRRAQHRGLPAEHDRHPESGQQRTQRRLPPQQLQQHEAQHRGRQHQGREQQQIRRRAPRPPQAPHPLRRHHPQRRHDRHRQAGAAQRQRQGRQIRLDRVHGCSPPSARGSSPKRRNSARARGVEREAIQALACCGRRLPRSTAAL